MLTVADTLAHAVTEYDRKEETKHQKNPKRRYHNPYALGQYLQAVTRAVDDIEQGVPLRKAIVGHFTGRLLDRCLIAVGESKSTDREQRGSLADFGY